MSEVMVIIPVGPRGSGKSIFCKQMSKYPGVIYISRDEILTERHGKISSNGYDGKFFYAEEVMFNRVSEIFQDKFNQIILFDCPTCCPKNRAEIIEKLRKHGIQTIIAWYFITSLEICLEWFKEFKKNNPDDWRDEESFTSDYELLHEDATDIEKWEPRRISNNKWKEEHFPSDYDVFDAIVKINPLQLIFPGILPGIGLLSKTQKNKT